ncbi:MAG: hypothetical protein RLY16_1194 [Bacteroidota bacterium]
MLRIGTLQLLLALLFSFGVVSPAFSQYPAIKSFQIDPTNPLHKITCVTQSSDGYFYTGTTHGLYRFDGIVFEKILSTPEINSDSITAIFEDKSKQLWIGYHNGVIARKIHNQIVPYNMEEGHPAKAITCITQDKVNNIWWGTNGEGIYYIHNNRQYLINEAEGLNDLNIHSLCITDDGDILAATDQGINICRITDKSKTVTALTPKNGLPDYLVTAIIPAGNNQFWIGLQDKGICQFDHNTEKFTQPETVSNWTNGQINSLALTRQYLWIATSESGLLQYDLFEKKIKTPAFGQFTTINTGQLLHDKEGNLWFSNNFNTLVHTYGETIRMLPAYPKDQYHTIHCIAVDQNNQIWTNTDKAIIHYKETNNQFVSKYYPIKELNFNTDITSLFCDRFNHLWIGTMGKGVFLFDIATGTYKHLNPIYPNLTTNVLSINGNHNSVSISGLEGANLIEIENQNATIQQPLKISNYNNIQDIGSIYIYAVYKDSSGDIWFATDGKGIARLHQGKFYHYNDPKILKDRHVYAITEGTDGSIWFSTSKEGIYRFDGKNFKNYSIAQGLSSTEISAIKTDREGNIIIIHKQSVDILNPTNGTITYLNNAKGIRDINSDLGGAYTNKEGNIYILSADGVVMFSPSVKTQSTPITILESVQIYNKIIPQDSANIFRYDENNLTFSFKGIFLSDPTHIYYQYKLEGLDSNWINTKDISKSFPRLQPGAYRFRVRSALNESFLGATEASYSFVIEKPFWKKPWFILATIALVCFLLYLYIRFRERNLQQVERLRNEKMKFEFEVLRNQVNPHFLFNSFNTLISEIEENPKDAVEYVEHLSDFFRNIVNYRDKNTISLQEELLLLDNYIFLQQKRYGQYLQLEKNIAATAATETHIPPLALQLLIENAIKHNAISKEKPLIIRLHINDENQLVIANNINKKFTTESGAGMGLENIINRYKLLTDAPVIIKNESEEFAVYLPILKK